MPLSCLTSRKCMCRWSQGNRGRSADMRDQEKGNIEDAVILRTDHRHPANQKEADSKRKRKTYSRTLDYPLLSSRSNPRDGRGKDAHGFHRERNPTGVAERVALSRTRFQGYLRINSQKPRGRGRRDSPAYDRRGFNGNVGTPSGQGTCQEVNAESPPWRDVSAWSSRYGRGGARWAGLNCPFNTGGLYALEAVGKRVLKALPRDCPVLGCMQA